MRCERRSAQSRASLLSTMKYLNWLKNSSSGRRRMQIHVSIGENHRFELHDALLVYGDRQRSFITRHQVTLRKDAPPTLEPAQPLTLGFLESLARSLGGH